MQLVTLYVGLIPAVSVTKNFLSSESSTLIPMSTLLLLGIVMKVCVKVLVVGHIKGRISNSIDYMKQVKNWYLPGNQLRYLLKRTMQLNECILFLFGQ